MADYSDDNEPLGGWVNYRRKQAEHLRAQRITTIIDAIEFKLDGHHRYCSFCGSFVPFVSAGIHRKYHRQQLEGVWDDV